MRFTPTEERQIVWEVLSQLWVDTAYDAGQLDELADRLARCGFSVRDLDRIAHREVCGAFALFSLTVLASGGMALPDWSFPKDQARQRIADWLSRPRRLSLIKPLRVAWFLVSRRFPSHL